MTAAWILVLAYLAGAVPTGYLLVKFTRGVDVRKIGSGNIGATNAARAAGIAAGVLVLLIDAGKAYLAVWLAGKMTADSPFWTPAAAVVVMLGNAYPVFLKFRGGKTVATFVGAFLRLTPVATGAVLLVWLGTAVISRRVSAGSLVAAATFPLGVWLILHPGTELVTASLAAAALIIWRHRDNIRRLRQGAEPAFSLSRKPR